MEECIDEVRLRFLKDLESLESLESLNVDARFVGLRGRGIRNLGKVTFMLLIRLKEAFDNKGRLFGEDTVLISKEGWGRRGIGTTTGSVFSFFTF